MQIKRSFGLFIFDLEQMLGLRCNGVAFNCLVNFSAFLFGRRLSNCFGMQTKAAEASAVEEKIAAIERKINSNRRRSDNTNVFDSNKWTNAVNIHVNQINFLVDAGRYFISACERVRCSCVYLSDRTCTSFSNATHLHSFAAGFLNSDDSIFIYFVQFGFSLAVHNAHVPCTKCI